MHLGIFVKASTLPLLIQSLFAVQLGNEIAQSGVNAPDEIYVVRIISVVAQSDKAGMLGNSEMEYLCTTSNSARQIKRQPDAKHVYTRGVARL